MLDIVGSRAPGEQRSKPTSRTDASSSLQVIQRLVRERWREYAGRYAAALLLMLIASGATALTAWIMKDVVNDIFVRRDQSAMVWLPAVVAIIFLVKGLATYFQEVWLRRIGNRLVAEYQKKIYDHLLQMNLTFFHKRPSKDLIMRFSRGAGAAREMLDLVAVSVGRDLFTLVGLIAVMVIQDPVLSITVLIAGPLAALMVHKMGQTLRNGAKQEASAATVIIGVIQETSQGAQVMKSFQLEGLLSRRMFAATETMQKVANHIAKVRAGVNPLIEVLGGISIAGVIAYAGWQATLGIETPGHIIAFITALLLAAEPARRLTRIHLQMKTLAVKVGLMFEILDTPIAESKEALGSPLRVEKGQVRFDRVSFAYSPGKAVLRDISFSAEAGEMTALVGRSGGGKTTIFSLLQGFWRPDTGNILIDGQSIDATALASWRRSIAFVSQDVFLFEGTIRENILAARPDASDDELRAAARAACADEFIQELPSGYDTSVGELGNLLSGGQRQRISIARAFLRDAPILLLDEPSSALDSETEHKIQESLAELMQGRTTIVIAHRFATVLRAQRIHVVEGGRIVESGTHKDLLGRGDRYARLYKLQFQERQE